MLPFAPIQTLHLKWNTPLKEIISQGNIEACALAVWKGCLAWDNQGTEKFPGSGEGLARSLRSVGDRRGRLKMSYIYLIERISCRELDQNISGTTNQQRCGLVRGASWMTNKDKTRWEVLGVEEGCHRWCFPRGALQWKRVEQIICGRGSLHGDDTFQSVSYFIGFYWYSICK